MGVLEENHGHDMRSQLVYKTRKVLLSINLINVIGEDGVKAYHTFTCGRRGESKTIVLKKFDEYCSPRTQIIYIFGTDSKPIRNQGTRRIHRNLINGTENNPPRQNCCPLIQSHQTKFYDIGLF